MKDAASDDLIHESTRKLRAMFGLDQPEPKEKKGVDALDKLIGIGLWCKMGLGLNEQQRQFHRSPTISRTSCGAPARLTPWSMSLVWIIARGAAAPRSNGSS